MIVLVSFGELEVSLFKKASTELRIDKRINYFDSRDALTSHCLKSAQRPGDALYPRVIVVNIDSETCIEDVRALKKTDNWRKIPIIGYGFLEDPNDVSEFYGAGGASCIRKPASYAELVDTTRAAMGYWLSMSTLPCDYLVEA